MRNSCKFLKKHYKPQPDGFILLPMLLILLSLILLLSLQMEHFYTHVIFTREAIDYFEAEQALIKILPEIEKKLKITKEIRAQPENQETRLKNYQLWPSFSVNHYIVRYQIQGVQVLTDAVRSEWYYSSLIVLGDHVVPKRIVYELISLCSLAESRCRPLQLTKIM